MPWPWTWGGNTYVGGPDGTGGSDGAGDADADGAALEARGRAAGDLASFPQIAHARAAHPTTTSA